MGGGGRVIEVGLNLNGMDQENEILLTGSTTKFRLNLCTL